MGVGEVAHHEERAHLAARRPRVSMVVEATVGAAERTSVNSVFIRGENDIIHGHTPREGISRPIYL